MMKPDHGQPPAQPAAPDAVTASALDLLQAILAELRRIREAIS